MSEHININPDAIYTLRSFAAALGISPRTVQRRVASRELPAPAKSGRDPQWLGKTYLLWLENKQAKAQGAR